ncbi:hypothetical protein GE061_011475 [Apolygus lucorum]|uniref:Uncharacterized protein n=1 Tax=Apolygus lucorum TaxID=248454 RepID=A0A6A4JT35_APOLU|nr:hypothetical protein GE061_011475 [Apolygus lucorum]
MACRGSYIDAVVVGREKRIIYGTPLISSTHYDVTGYFVRIDNAQNFSWLIRYFLHPRATKPLCGGAALTPQIIQTACHCIARSWSDPIIEGSTSYHYPNARNGWEEMVILHHGHQTEEQMIDGVWSRKFLVHEKCRMFNATGDLTHDFGMILTREVLKQSNNPLVKYSFAPLYTQTDLVKQYYRNMKYESICLYLGFGKYYFNEDKLYAGVPSILQHGWRVLRNYWECFLRETYGHSHWYGTHINSFNKFNYTKDCTWVCTTFFGKERAITAHGDSGGPVVCGGVYYGIVQSSLGILGNTGFESWEHTAALAFAIFENSAEYREDLTNRLWHYWGTDLTPPKILDRATLDPFHPDQIYSSARPDGQRRQF